MTRGARRACWPHASWLCVAALLLVPALLDAQQARPALSAGRVIGETVGGAYAGIGGFVIGRYLGERAGDILGVQSDVTRDRIGFASGVLLGGLATADCPFEPAPPATYRRSAHWVMPQLTATIEMTEFTNEGLVRHASFVELHEGTN